LTWKAKFARSYLKLSLKGVIKLIQVTVHAGNGEQAIRNLKRKMQRELIFRSMKMSRFFEPESVKKVRKQQESERRRRKLVRKKMMES
jgi:small subunit ribosomal protein S21